ncbi:hypothetical protein [Actinosynnema sp. NPDC020468]|uniref:hypothetical protein n=1 Tax=Actinosynnema sp. NPDC020468 TaxID=3154488 RepID=UPI0033D8F6EF
MTEPDPRPRSDEAPEVGATAPPVPTPESFAALEANLEALMNDKMSELDGMLAGLEELVVRLEGEITGLEPPPDGTATP